MGPDFTAMNQVRWIRITMFPGTGLVEPSMARVASERERMKDLPYVMDQPRQECVLGSIKQHCAFRCWPLYAVHVRTNHVHAVVEAPAPPEKVLNEIKAYASRALNDAGLDTPDRRRWSRHGSTRYLWKRDEVDAAIAYVADQQGEPMAIYVNGEVSW